MYRVENVAFQPTGFVIALFDEANSSDIRLLVETNVSSLELLNGPAILKS